MDPIAYKAYLQRALIKRGFPIGNAKIEVAYRDFDPSRNIVFRCISDGRHPLCSECRKTLLTKGRILGDPISFSISMSKEFVYDDVYIPELDNIAEDIIDHFAKNDCVSCSRNIRKLRE